MNQHLSTGQEQGPAGGLENPGGRPIFLDEIEASDYMGGLSPKTLQAWRFRGSGPRFFKIGRLVRYLKNDLDEFLKSRSRTSTSDHSGDAGK